VITVGSSVGGGSDPWRGGGAAASAAGPPRSPRPLQPGVRRIALDATADIATNVASVQARL